MAEELEISRGGVVSVDVETIRAIAAQLRIAEERIQAAITKVRNAQAEASGFTELADLAYRTGAIGNELSRRASSVAEISSGATRMAAAYEIVEHRSRLAFAGALDVRSMVELRRSLASHLSRSAEAVALADELVKGREQQRKVAFSKQAWGAVAFGPYGALVVMMALRKFLDVIAEFGRGIPSAAAEGESSVQVSSGGSAHAKPPKNLAETLERIPDGEAQVRVERYVMPDGTKQFVAYIAGTRELFGSDPWNMKSNLDLYSAQKVSTSFEATKQALLAAGASGTDAVHLVGHSQGGMIAGHLAMTGEFNIRSVITAGSPIEPVLPDSVLSVQLRHSDDPVSALASGGSPGGTGSKLSFVVEREGDPDLGMHDILIPTHNLDRYIDTARMVDASSDPRAVGLQKLWSQLGSASSVVATEFTASVPNTEILAPGSADQGVI